MQDCNALVNRQFRQACYRGILDDVQRLFEGRFAGDGFVAAARGNHVHICKWLFGASSVLRAASGSCHWRAAYDTAVHHFQAAIWMLEVTHDPNTALTPLDPTLTFLRALDVEDLAAAQRIGVFLRDEYCVSSYCSLPVRVTRCNRWIAAFYPRFKSRSSLVDIRYFPDAMARKLARDARWMFTTACICAALRRSFVSVVVQVLRQSRQSRHYRHLFFSGL